MKTIQKKYADMHFNHPPNTMQQSKYILVFTDLFEAIHHLPLKVQDALAGAIVRYLAFAEEPDFNPLALKYRATAVALWRVMETILKHSRSRRDTPADDKTGADDNAADDNAAADNAAADNTAADTRAHAITPDRTPAHEKDIDKDKEIDKDNISFGDAYASLSSGTPADAAAVSPPQKWSTTDISPPRSMSDGLRCDT